MQLERWSHQGAVKTAKDTHESIRDVLHSCERLDDKSFEIYLQGSYKNCTNIRGDMDVDLVVQLNSIFCSNLSEEQKRKFGFVKAEYTWKDFRQDVLNALVDHYGESKVSEGNKAIKVQTSRLPADVVVCIQYRKYPPNPVDESDFVEGMTFLTRNEGWKIINYPKLHYENGVTKHQNTGGRYKKLVRIFKNARNYLEECGSITSSLAPSYFLESLLYNVPDEQFSGNLQTTFYNTISWLEKADFSNFKCQNEQLPLFGERLEQWSINSAKEFVQKLIELWKNW